VFLAFYPQPFNFLKWMAEAIGVSLKTENEEYAGKTMQTRGSEGGRRGFTGTSMHAFRWQVPR
jgi:hypothetical protein